MNQIFQTIWNVAMLGISLAYFGSLGAVTFYLGQSALKLHKQGLISLTRLTHSLESPRHGSHSTAASRD